MASKRALAVALDNLPFPRGVSAFTFIHIRNSLTLKDSKRPAHESNALFSMSLYSPVAEKGNSRQLGFRYAGFSETHA